MSTITEKKKILLIDGNNMFFRAYCASPALNIDGEHVGAITGFLYSLQKCVKDTRPHQIFVIWDGEGGSKKRQQIRSDYKEGRKMPRPIRLNRALDVPQTEEDENACRLHQMAVIIELLNELPIIQLCEKSVEADDFISYLNNKFSCQDSYIKIIVSNDKDFIQLLNKCTLLYRPIKTEYVTYKDAIKNYSVHPNNMALARAVEGDNSDNLNGVPRVGIKTLVKFIPEFSKEETLTIDQLKQLCEERKEKGKTVQNIIDFIDRVEQNYKIMQLYMPLIPMETKFKIDEQISNFKFNLFPTNFFDILKKEGIIGSSFEEIVKHSQHIIKENTK